MPQRPLHGGIAGSSRAVTVRLPRQDRARLAALARGAGVTESEALRQLVRAAASETTAAGACDRCGALGYDLRNPGLRDGPSATDPRLLFWMVGGRRLCGDCRILR